MGKSLSKYQMSSPDGASNHVTPDDIAVTSLAAKFTTSFSSPDKPRPITCTNDTHNDTTTLERDRQGQNEHAKKLSSQVRDRENVKDSRTSSEVSGGKSYKEMMDRDRSRCQEKYARQAEFGIGCWRPRRLQCLAKTLWTFIFLYGPCAVWLVTAGQYVRTQVTSMERHFRVNSSKMGILLSTNDIGSLIFVLLGSHFGKFRHIPRVLALSALATGLFLMALSLIQAITPTYLPKGDTSTPANITNTSQTDDQDRYLCHNQNPDRNQTSITSEEVQGSDNDDVTVSTHWGFYLTCFLLFAVGASVSYRLSLQTCYIERNIRHKAQSGMMLGVLVTAMVFGSPISLLLGGAMNALPVDMGDSKMDIYDPRWISAWWLGFLIIGACAAVLSLPVFLLPRYIIYDEDSTGAGSCCGKKPTPPEDNSAVITDSGVWRDVTEEDVSKQESRDPTSDKDREKSAPGDEEHDGESNFLDQVKGQSKFR